MNSLGEITSQKVYPPALLLQNLGTWSQLGSHSQHEKNCDGCILKSRAAGEMTADDSRFCPHCGKRFKPSVHNKRFCKPGCRTCYHKNRRNALVPAMNAAYGMGQDHALDVLEKSGVTRVILALGALGYVYDGKQWKLRS